MLFDYGRLVFFQGYESEESKLLALVDDISRLLGGDHNGAPLVSRPASTHGIPCTPALMTNPSLVATPTQINNNHLYVENSLIKNFVFY